MMSPHEHLIYTAISRANECGRMPDDKELSRATGLTIVETFAAIRSLFAKNLIVLNPPQGKPN